MNELDNTFAEIVHIIEESREDLIVLAILWTLQYNK